MSHQVPSQDQWLTRVCWSGSVGNLALRADAHEDLPTSLDGGLRSGLGDCGPKLSGELLRSHFQKHAELQNSENLKAGHATALVSVSGRVIDTLQRAFSKYHDGELPGDIYIVFISVPAEVRHSTAIHSAQVLAEECDFEDSIQFKYELLFEWAIPKEFVHHWVTVETLLQRGLNMDRYILKDGSFPSTSELCYAMADSYFIDISCWETGLELGLFARRFGARSPYGWIAEQLLRDFAKSSQVNGDVQSFLWIRFEDGENLPLGPFSLKAIADGIDTAIIEWWLLDDGFLADVEEHEIQCELTENRYVDACVDFHEEWKYADEESEAYINAHATLEKEINEMYATLERDAIRIGL